MESRLQLQRGSTNRITEIYIMDADGSTLRPILQPVGDDNVHPAWSPDTRRIVFTSGNGSKSALYVFEMA